MKILHKKILIFVVILTIVLSMFCVTAFAAVENDFYGAYYFNEELAGIGDYATSYFDVPFTCGDEMFTGFNFFYRGYWVLQYVVKPNDDILYSVDVYDTNNGWLDDSYRYIDIYRNDISPRLYMFLLENQCSLVPSDSWYWDINDILVSTLFGSSEVPEEASFALSLVSIILTLLAVLLPVLLCFGIFFWIIKRV